MFTLEKLFRKIYNRVAKHANSFCEVRGVENTVENIQEILKDYYKNAISCTDAEAEELATISNQHMPKDLMCRVIAFEMLGLDRNEKFDLKEYYDFGAGLIYLYTNDMNIKEEDVKEILASSWVGNVYREFLKML